MYFNILGMPYMNSLHVIQLKKFNSKNEKINNLLFLAYTEYSILNPGLKNRLLSYINYLTAYSSKCL